MKPGPKTTDEDRQLTAAALDMARRARQGSSVTMATALTMQREQRCGTCVAHGAGGRLTIEPEDNDTAELRCLPHAVTLARIRFDS